MEVSSKLVPETLRAQCNAAITKLEEDNQALNMVSDSLEQFINDSSIQSNSFDTMKQQIKDYLVIIQAMETANSSDISDYQFLAGIVGENVLDGNLVTAKELSEDNKKEAKRNAEKARKCAYLFRLINQPLAQAFMNNAQWYELEMEKHQAVIDYCQEKIDQYDAIEAETCDLFVAGESLRRTVQSALADLGGTFRNGCYEPSLNAEWRTQINKQLHIQADEYVSEFYDKLPEALKQYLAEDDFAATEDGFVMCTKSLENVFISMGMQSEDEIYDGVTVGNYDDWYLAGVIGSDSNITYTLIKMRELDDSQTGPGSAVPFIELDMTACEEVFTKISEDEDVSDQDWKNLYNAFYGVTNQANQESTVLRDYFANPSSEGSYLIADCFVEKVAESGCFTDGVWQLTVSYEDNDKYARSYLDELEVLGIYDKDNNTITVQDVNHLTPSEYNAILTVTTGNIDVYSFAGENYFHAMAQQIADVEQALGSGPAGSGVSRLVGDLIEDHAISSDAGVGESTRGGYEKFFKDPESDIYNQQKELHPGR